MSQQPGAQDATPHTAYILSLIGSILMIISSIVALVLAGFASALPRYYALHRLGYYSMMPLFIYMPVILVIVGIIGLVVGALATYFSLRLGKLNDVNAVHSTGIVLLILSIIGLFTGASGFFIGFILLLIGSILAISWKP
ncbi:hypothetical protein [Vulcanisaeta souniana]|nr:hypothetical protein [Vulcanisaeta souniana]GGI79099.1 hypothetical protein GCM10007112_15080 [Vulcanisaeta souniana JCM 11219]